MSRLLLGRMLLLLGLIVALASCSRFPGVGGNPTVVLPTFAVPTLPPDATATTAPPTATATNPATVPAATSTAAPASPTPTSARTATSVAVATPHGDGNCSYKATFLGDVTIPDNTVIPAGTAFVKTWRLRNDGTCTWGSAGFALHSLVLVGGNRLGAPEVVGLPPAVRQGGTVDLSVPMVAPAVPGTYKSEWMLQVDNGPRFGVGPNGSVALYVQIVAGPPSTSSGVTRITFAQGATSAAVQGSLQAGQSQEFAVSALQGQMMMLTLSSSSSTATLSVRGAQGINPQVLRSIPGGAYWLGQLTATQDYIIRVSGGSAAGNFNLDVTVPQRITFAPGAITATSDGITNARRTVTYLLRASRGQAMTVTLNSPANSAGLTIYGLDDGNPLVRAVSGATTWSGLLPGTQDYVIEVVPAVDTAFTFSLQTVVQ